APGALSQPAASWPAGSRRPERRAPLSRAPGAGGEGDYPPFRPCMVQKDGKCLEASRRLTNDREGRWHVRDSSLTEVLTDPCNTALLEIGQRATESTHACLGRRGLICFPSELPET